jgi:hypothetical protein
VIRLPRIERWPSHPFEGAEINRRETSGLIRFYQVFAGIGNGQAPGTTTGRATGAAGLAALRFAAGLRRTSFFPPFAARFLPPRLFAFAIPPSSRSAAPADQLNVALPGT